MQQLTLDESDMHVCMFHWHFVMGSLHIIGSSLMVLWSFLLFEHVKRKGVGVIDVCFGVK